MRNSRKGFTLAEVLVTLAIIGVVAALTIPTLIQSTNSQRYTTGLKKMLSTLNSAVQTKSATDGLDTSSVTPGTADADNKALADFFKTSLNVIEDDGKGLLTLADGSTIQFINGPGIDTMGCQDTHVNADSSAGSDNLCDLFADGGGAIEAGLTAGAPNITCPNPAAGTAITANYCMAYIDVNGAKLPNRVVSATNTSSDIYLVGIGVSSVVPVDGGALTIPSGTGEFASGDTSDQAPGTQSIVAVTN